MEMSTLEAEEAKQLQAEVERQVARYLKASEYLATPDPPTGLTPRRVVFERDPLTLYHYTPIAPEVYRTPLLIVMSLVTKPYILDIAPKQSLIEFLLEQGHDVFLVDWGEPKPEHRHFRVDTYVDDFLPECIQAVLRETGEEQLTLLGYCLGGLICCLYAATRACPEVRNLICFTTPVDTDGLTLFKSWLDERYFPLDDLLETCGNVPPDLLSLGFELLRPASPAARSARLWDNIQDPNFVESFRRLGRWSGDHVPFPGAAFRQLTEEYIRDNRMLRNEWEIGGRRADLGRITAPFLHVLAEHDHIVPYAAAKPLVGMVGSEDREEVILKGGHASLVAGHSVRTRLGPRLDAWLAPRSA